MKPDFLNDKDKINKISQKELIEGLKKIEKKTQERKKTLMWGTWPPYQ